MAMKDEFRVSGVRFRGGRTLHNIRHPKNGQWAGTLEAACGKTGQQSFGFTNRPASRCRGCAAALAADEQKVS